MLVSLYNCIDDLQRLQALLVMAVADSAFRTASSARSFRADICCSNARQTR